MSQHYEKRAESVVNNFLNLLDPEARECLTQEQTDHLSMLVESAISTAVLDQLEAIADEISDLSVLIRRRAERYDGDEQAA
jgi:hypothetical protein